MVSPVQEKIKLVQFYECSDHNEILRVELDKNSNTVDLAIYEHSNFEKCHGTLDICSPKGYWDEFMMLWQRIKYAFWHIRTGKIYSDNMVLHKEEVGKLSRDLLGLYLEMDNTGNKMSRTKGSGWGGGVLLYQLCPNCNKKKAIYSVGFHPQLNFKCTSCKKRFFSETLEPKLYR